MKINGIKIGEIRRKYAQQSKKLDQSNRSRPQDSMSISNKAKQISGIEKKLAEIPDVRQDKVDSLKNAIQNGEYKVDSKALARKLLGTLDQE